MTGLGKVVCVVIVAESILEARLVRDLESCGAVGWTVGATWGHGPRDRKVSDLEGGSIRIETLVSQDVAQRIWAVLADDYFADYALTAWSYDVNVARLDRYAPGS
jgi:nitrogen regulatory protein P-II 2